MLGYWLSPADAGSEFRGQGPPRMEPAPPSPSTPEADFVLPQAGFRRPPPRAISSRRDFVFSENHNHAPCVYIIHPRYATKTPQSLEGGIIVAWAALGGRRRRRSPQALVLSNTSPEPALAGGIMPGWEKVFISRPYRPPAAGDPVF